MIEERIKYIKEKYNIECPAPTKYEPVDLPIASLIDHTLLANDATPAQVEKLCNEAKEHEFASVCVNQCYAGLAYSILKGTKSKVCCVINFPLGSASTDVKVAETLSAIKSGASEIDMVINCGWMKGGRYKEVLDDIASVAKACHENGAILKVIIEATCLEKDELIIDSCLLSAAAGADFVKTSTGMHKNGGAKVEHVKLMRETVGGKLGVKAAGGIKTGLDAMKMIEAGASRLGASSGIAIVTSFKK